jgi:5-(carboxyamino)imidazole ribonucleotide synthase
VASTYTDNAALEQFARGLDVVTYEFENVPVEAACHLEDLVPVYPAPVALQKAQDRFVEKSFLCELGIPTPRFTIDLKGKPIDGIGFPAVLKTRRLGYDGKGQSVVHSQTDLDDELKNTNTNELILEEFIPFDRELSIIGVRNRVRRNEVLSIGGKSSPRRDPAFVTRDRSCFTAIAKSGGSV